MIGEQGASAYWVARDRALEERLHRVIDARQTSGHWDRVPFEMRSRTERRRADTATKFLEGGQ